MAPIERKFFARLSGYLAAPKRPCSVRTDRIVQRINLHLALGGDFVTGADSASAVPGGR